jgi:hypothetical protein
MLTNFDELTCHQIPSTFDHPDTSDRAWTEKLWCNVHDTRGELVVAVGFGVYPNRNVLDGFGCVNVKNTEQWNMRLSRVLRPGIDEIALGPLSYRVVEPYRKVRIAMGENAYGFSFDLEFAATMEPGEEKPQYARSRGRVYVNTCRYAQLGRANGWVNVDGLRYDVEADRFYAQRDHSWGIRMGLGADEQGVQALDYERFTAMMINWIALQFKDWGIYCYLIEKDGGSVEQLSGSVVGRVDGKTMQKRIVGVEHMFEFHEGSQRMKSGRMAFHCAGGEKIEISMRELTCMYLRGGAYVGYKGYRHGTWMGEYWEDGEAWNVGDPVVANEVHGLDDTVVEARCGSEVGYGIIENMIFAPFKKYGFTDWGFKPA